ncbi:MAG: cyanophycinase [Planctomycetota bacterium]
MLQKLGLLVLICFCQQPIAAQDGQPKRKLVIAGGGSLPDSIIRKFRELAGEQPRLVVIPTASSAKPNEAGISQLWKERGFEQVEVLHTRDKSQANKSDFSDSLNQATAVWFGGGSQSRIADAYCDTLVETRLFELLKRGGVIGGTSAGAAIQSKVMIASGRTEPQLKTGLGFLEECIIDQHFLARDRLRRSINAIKQQPQKIGIGIDEGTALVVVGNAAEVIGRSYVLRIASEETRLDIRSYESGEIVRLALNSGGDDS